MPMLPKILFATLIMAMAFVTAMACDCVTRSEAENFANADAVFIAKVIDTVSDGTQEDAIFETTRWLKGQQRETVVVSSNRTNCDVSFSARSTYIVYAKNINGQLMTSICSGTRVIGGRFEFRGHRVRTCDYYESPISYQRIAAITALSVTFSISLGLVVGAIKRRFRK